ncbi:MAG: type II secretion system F family protein [Phycisphaerales bacterium]
MNLPTFRYIPATTANGLAAGVIDAPDRAAAVRSLISRGITPASVDVMAAGAPVAKASTSGPAARITRPSPRRGRAMNLAETASFVKELATAILAGLPMVPALRTLAKQGRTPAQREMIAHLIAEVEQGRTLADAAASWGPPFSELVVNLMRAGEASGRLGEVLEQSADLLEKDLALRRSLLAATLYPAILATLVCAAVAVMTTVIIPRVLAPLKGQLKTLPLPTRIVQGAAEFFGQWWWLIILALGIGILLWRRAMATPGPRLAIDSFTLRVPVVGPLVRDALVARFTRTLGTLVSAGLPVLSALRLTGATLTNHAMRAAIRSVCDQVSAGRTIAEPLEKAGLFPPLLVQIVSLGERSGKLPQLLLQAAGSLDTRTEMRVKVVTNILPPILVVIAAAVAGGVVAAIILPLLDMQEAIPK